LPGAFDMESNKDPCSRRNYTTQDLARRHNRLVSLLNDEFDF
jgi:hypothetical protein